MKQNVNATGSTTDLYYPRAWAYARESKDTPALPQQLADLWQIGRCGLQRCFGV